MKNLGKSFLVIGASMVCVGAFATLEDNGWSLQNRVKIGYDDNVYQSEKKTDSMFISDILNVKGKFSFSQRSDLVVYWQPEIRFRPDADPKTISYQDLYAQLNHSVSPRVFVTLSDRFRYQDKDGQSGLGKSPDQNYIENDLMGAIDYTINSVSQAKIGAGYELRRWDEDAYGKWDKTLLRGGADYDQYRVNGSYIRQLRENVTQGLVGVTYTDHEYDGSRGGYNSTAVYGGLDHNFTPNVSGTARLGGSFTRVENAFGKKDDSGAPYAQATLSYKPTGRTTIDGLVEYSIYRADNSSYNAQDRLKMMAGVRHDLTAKINVSSSVSFTHSVYQSDYSTAGVVSGDIDDDYVTFSVRGSYEINKNNAIDAGYSYSERWADSPLAEYTRNVVDIGWRLTL